MRVSVTTAASAGVPAAGLISLAAEGSAGDGDDLGVPLVELLSLVGDALSSYQEQIADEAYLGVSTREDGSIRIALLGGLEPACCVVADDRHVFFITIDAETTEATVHFGDGQVGDRPPGGGEGVGATYRRGAGEAGAIEIGGLCLEEPFVVIVVPDPRTSVRCLHVWRSRDLSRS